MQKKIDDWERQLWSIISNLTSQAIESVSDNRNKSTILALEALLNAELKSFISQEIQSAREEGRQEMLNTLRSWEPFQMKPLVKNEPITLARADYDDKIRQQEKERILEIIKGMKHECSVTCEWNSALSTLIKEIN